MSRRNSTGEPEDAGEHQVDHEELAVRLRLFPQPPEDGKADDPEEHFVDRGRMAGRVIGDDAARVPAGDLREDREGA